MAGYTPPKAADQRARRNKDTRPSSTVEIGPFEIPLAPPDDLLGDDESWHPATLRWWKRWAESPLAAKLPAVDWSELEATARLHQTFMAGDSKLAAELRLRMEKFGATPEARMKLRILVTEAEAKDPSDTSGALGAPDDARARWGHLAVVAPVASGE